MFVLLYNQLLLALIQSLTHLHAQLTLKCSSVHWKQVTCCTLYNYACEIMLDSVRVYFIKNDLTTMCSVLAICLLDRLVYYTSLVKRYPDLDLHLTFTETFILPSLLPCPSSYLHWDLDLHLTFTVTLPFRLSLLLYWAHLHWLIFKLNISIHTLLQVIYWICGFCPCKVQFNITIFMYSMIAVKYEDGYWHLIYWICRFCWESLSRLTLTILYFCMITVQCEGR